MKHFTRLCGCKEKEIDLLDVPNKNLKSHNCEVSLPTIEAINESNILSQTTHGNNQ